MRSYNLKNSFCLVLLTMVAMACASVPLTDRKQLAVIPSSDMISLGVDSYAAIINEEGVSSNQEYIDRVNRVGSRIRVAVEEFLRDNNLTERIEGYRWEFNVLRSDQVNAFALPGGKIAFYEGIMPICRDDAGVAVVMSHEIAHAIARHGNERMSQGLLVNLGGVALSEALKSEPRMTRDLALAAFGIGSQVGIMLPYSRLHETEADELGLYFMAMAGYDPHEAPPFWQRMNKEGGQRPPEFLSTHPHPESRIEHLNEVMPKAMKYYREPQEQ